MAKEVIFVADDFGMNEEINDAILHTHLSGNLIGATLMMGQPGTAAAVEMARANRSLQIGWHLHLIDSVPTTIERWPWDSSATAGVAIALSPGVRDLVRHEISAQWSLFLRTGLQCRFINSHHHLHAHPFVYRTILETVGPHYAGWIRLGQPRAPGRSSISLLWSLLEAIYLKRRRRLSHWRSTDTLWGVRPRLNAEKVRAIIADLPDGFHEFLFHPRTLSCPDTLCLLELKALLAQD